MCLQDEVQRHKEEIVAIYRDFGIYEFARSVMWVMQQVFDMDDRYLLVEPNDETGKRLLAEIIEVGNFGHTFSEYHLYNESTAHRWMRRAKRRLRLIQYNGLGVLCSPFYKFNIEMWKREIIRIYNL